jgi:hypothetical protein
MVERICVCTFWGGGLLPILQQCERMLTDAKHYLQPSNSQVKENILVDFSFHVAAFGKQILN